MERTASEYYLQNLDSAESHTIFGGQNKIGKYPSCDIVINSEISSRLHCIVQVDDDLVKIIDCSSNGTYINNRKLHNQEQIIKLNTHIGIDKMDFGPTYQHNFVLKSVTNDSDTGPHKREPVINRDLHIIEIDSSDSECEDVSLNNNNLQQEHDSNIISQPEFRPQFNKINQPESNQISQPESNQISQPEFRPEFNYLNNNNSEMAYNNNNNEVPSTLRTKRKKLQLAIDIFGAAIITDIQKDDQYKDLIDPDIKIEQTNVSDLVQIHHSNDENTNDMDLANDELLQPLEHAKSTLAKEIEEFDQYYTRMSSIQHSKDLVITISDDDDDMDEPSAAVNVEKQIEKEPINKPSTSIKTERYYRNLEFFNNYVEKDGTIRENDKKRKLDADTKVIDSDDTNSSTESSTNSVAPIAKKRNTEGNTSSSYVTIETMASQSTEDEEEVTVNQTNELTIIMGVCRCPRKSCIKNRLNKLRFSTLEEILEKKKHLKVRFNEKLDVKSYDSYESICNLGKVGIAKDAEKPIEQTEEEITDENNDLNRSYEMKQNILGKVLAWKPSLFENIHQQLRPGDLRPMLHHYTSFKTYANTVHRLMKYEFWVKLRQENRKWYRNIVLTHFQVLENTIPEHKRILYFCEELAHNNVNLFLEADLVSIEISENYRILGYIRNVQVLYKNCKKYWDITIESNWTEMAHNKMKVFRKNTIKVFKLSEIRFELAAFEALYLMKDSPLLNVLLNPNLLKNANNDITNVEYVGYDKLNPINTTILLKTYIGCISADCKNPTIQLIEGAPGTGKTCLIVNLLLQLMYGDESRNERRKFLVCAHNDQAVDIIAMKLIHIRQKMGKRKRFTVIRFGDKDKIGSCVRAFTLQEYHCKTKPTTGVESIEQEVEFLTSRIAQLRRTNTNGTNNIEIDTFSTELYRLYDLDRARKTSLLNDTQIILCTLESSVKLKDSVASFDICIIDDATQCNEPYCLLPFQFGIKSLVLVGDTSQSAACISNIAKDYNYGKSLFTRFKESIDDKLVIPILSQQCRMHQELLSFPNNYFFKNSIKNDTKYRQNLGIRPYSIINLNYIQNDNNNRVVNDCRVAKCVIKLIENISKKLKLKYYKYGIISPYVKHCDNLYKILKQSSILSNTNSIEINTINAFEGREKDVIIISYDNTTDIGFLNDLNLLKVALTRAKACLILCGNFEKFSHIPFWNALFADAKKRSVYHSYNTDVMRNFNQLMSKIEY